MVDLAKVINENTFVISDTHFGHAKVLQFEPIRVEYLSDYNSDVSSECNELLELLEIIPVDEHRTHDRINHLCKYLIEFHDSMLIEKWNNVVGANDTVLCLGDFAFKGIEEYTQALNGNKILLRGNHDLKSARTYIQAGWKSVIESVQLNLNGRLFEMSPKTDIYWNGFLTRINGWRILFSHYPIYNNNEWDLKKYGNITDMLEDVFESYGGEINFAGHTHSKLSNFENGINVSIEHCTSLTPMKIGDVLEMNGYGEK